MKTLHTFALIACLAVPAAAQTPAPATAAAPAADVTGTWNATFNSAQGPVPAQFKLAKTGDKLTGTISSQMGEAPIQAEVKAKDLSIWFDMQGQNGPLSIELAGTVDGDTAKGTFSAGGTAAGDWSATRAKDAAAKDAPKEPAKDQPAAAAKADLTGTWNVTVELPSMTANPTIVLKQDGEKLTGDYVSAQYGKYAITGTVKGEDVSFWFAMNVEGNALNVTYTSKLGKDGSLQGSVNYGDMMNGTFTATKNK